MGRSRTRSSAKRKEKKSTGKEGGKRKADKKADDKKTKKEKKSRWEDENKSKDAPKELEPSTSKDADDDLHPPDLKDLLGDKEKMVGHLFRSISAAALQGLIPDYLKNRSIEELKQLCLKEVQDMSDESILYILSGKDPDSSEEIKNILPEMEAEEEEASSSAKEKDNVEETCETSEIQETKEVADAETSEDAAAAIGDDAELLELEMRARAIRSLLRAKGLLE